MSNRKPRTEDLADSAESLRRGPPIWFHAVLLLLMVLVMAAIPFVGLILLQIR